MNAATHPFEKTLGPGPYRFVGVAEIPSTAVAEANPDAYMNRIRNLPQVERGMGTCAHCGHAIMVVCIVEIGDGKRYGVGSDCILKVADEPAIIDKTKNAIAKRLKERAREKKIAERDRLSRFVKANAASLQTQPHPNPFLAEQGKTLFDYANFIIASGGNSGVSRLIKVVLVPKEFK